jgi:hypothetical protein
MLTRRTFGAGIAAGALGMTVSKAYTAEEFDAWLIRDEVGRKGDDVQVFGRVTGHKYNWFDKDWNLYVEPHPGINDPEFGLTGEFLLTNLANMRNRSGIIHCEISPAGKYGGGDNEKKYFERLVGKEVAVVGTFVEDTKHENKTEIHPITRTNARAASTVIEGRIQVSSRFRK